MFTITLLSGKQCQTEISKDDLFILYKSVVQKRAAILIQVFWSGQEVAIDLRRLDPDATFTPPVQETGAVAA